MNRYLITYGDESAFFTCEAENCIHAAEQFIDWSEDKEGDINEISIVLPVIGSDTIGIHPSVTEYAGFAGDGTFLGVDTLRIIVIDNSRFTDEDITSEIEQIFKELP